MELKKSPRLNLNTCEELFEKLEWDYSCLEKDWANTYLAFNFAITANHLFADWINSIGTKSQKRRKNQLPNSAASLFNVWRDIANATKHYKLNKKSQDKQVVTDISTPEIHDWHAFIVSGPVVYVSVKKARPSISMLSGVTLQCLAWIINADEGDFEFPADIHESLKYIFQEVQGS